MYKISIIIPVFNVEDTIQNAFDSILRQSIGFDNLEVIFIDDKSTDESANLIKKFDNDYSNVKAICLDENSGFAGKPRNIGIENATADYLMFLDPDDVFLDNACEVLYDNITESDLELVSGNYDINRDNEIIRNNWNILKLEDGEECQINTITENFNFLLTTPSVWSKIYKKEFILKENIEFLVGVPAQDLVFVSEALLNAKGIKFINIPVVEYTPRQSGDNKSVTSTKTKSVLAGFIKSYTALFNIAKRYNKNYAWIGPRNLFFWIKQFSLSNLSIRDKIDLLHMAEPLFEEFIKSDKIRPPKYLDIFLELISKKDYLNASRVSEKLDIFYDDKIIIENIKNKALFLLFFGLDIKIGGLAKATFKRANILKQHGYNVTLLNLNESKNFDFILENFHDIGYLDKSIDIINIIEYYANENTLDASSKYIHENNEDCIIKKTETNDKTIEIDYYDPSGNGKLIKSEAYFNKYSCIKTYENNKLKSEEFYTNDGFNYLRITYEHKNKPYVLIDRKTNLELKFESMYDFHNYFIESILLKCDNKPFLINENSGRIPNFNNIDSSLAYKIASIHTNPYAGEHHFGSFLRDDFTIFEDISKLDYIVVLTEALKRDLIKEFDVTDIEAIPNFVTPPKYLNKRPVEKENNKFSMFARLSPEKKISDAIKAFEIVAQKRNDAIFEIYGRAVTPGELKEEKRLKELVDELNLTDNVIFKGHAANVDEKMSESLATLFTSKFEGLGMTVIESMINSTLVISYNLYYGPSDFINHGETGYLVKQDDFEGLAKYMLELLENPIKSIEMGKLARKQVLNQINPETLFKKWENVLKNVCVHSIEKDIKDPNSIDPEIAVKLDEFERLKIKFYRENHKLYRQNKLLKNQIEAENEDTMKKITKKIKFLK